MPSSLWKKKHISLSDITLHSINSSSSSSSFFCTSIPPSFTHSDSCSAVTAPSPSHASTVRAEFVTSEVEAEEVRYLTA